MAGQQSIAVLSTLRGLPLPDDVVRLIVMYSIPDELGLSMPNASDTVIVPVSNTFRQWVTCADSGGLLPSEVLVFIRMQLRDEVALY